MNTSPDRLFFQLFLISVIIPLVAMLAFPALAAAGQPVEITGQVAMKSANCFNPEPHHHEIEFFVVDEKKNTRVRLKGADEFLKNIGPRQRVRVRGIPVNANPKATASGAPRSRAINRVEMQVDEIEVIAEPEAAGVTDPGSAEGGTSESATDGAGGSETAQGANTLTELSCLLVFVSTNTHGCMTSVTNATKLLFNNTNNSNEGMQAITKGRYGLKPFDDGDGGTSNDHIIELTLAVNSADHNTSSIETLTLNALFGTGGQGLTRLDYDRILIFAPDGITNKGFTAYAYYPWGSYTTKGMVSVYGNSYGNSRMNGYLHELGHNFGFAHSSKGGSEYGDGTCVMGSSRSSNKTQTYNVAKLLEKDWLDLFPNAELALSTNSADRTIDLYPLSSDPNVVTGTIAVSFPGTDYYAAYRRDAPPYGYLSKASDIDKVFIYTRASGSLIKSYQVQNLAVGGSHTGSGKVHFERYGPNNEYATVSFDMDDGNAKPVATAQSVTTNVNSSLAMTLSGTDADGNTLSYEVVEDPSNGSLSGTAPNLTYTPTTEFVGVDSFVFKVNDGKISSFATVTITSNAAPVANDQSASVFLNTDESIILTATDANGDNLTYSVVGGPSNGTLTGTAPNLTYIPDSNYSGSDSFTFKANDGLVDSSTATVSITVLPSSNDPPTVIINTPDQTVYLQTVTIIPGLYYGTASGDINESTPNPETEILVDVSSRTENSIAGNTTEIYTGNIFDADGQISFTEHIDDKARIWIDGNLVLSNDAWNTRTQTANLNLAPGWHTIEIRISNGVGGSGPVGGEIGIGYDPAGGTAWQILTDPGDGSFLRINQNAVSAATATSQEITITPVGANTFHLYAMTNQTINVIEAVANLEGTVTDAEQIPTTTWTRVGGAGAGDVTFGDASAVDTTATFTEAGIYVLRLTADDGYDTVFEEVAITVNPALPAVYASWISGSFSNPFNDTSITGNPDGDNTNNLLEFAFGTDPTLADGGPLSSDGTTIGTTNGEPIIKDVEPNSFEFYFVRRDDHGSSGSLNYTVQFSSDLSTFYSSAVVPVFVADSGTNADYEVVKVTYPSSLPNGMAAKFGRIQVTAAP
ncbi:Ig-like domain-containing protein [Rubritalea profundi]|nr:Ig-like domain-containing protein [Rubritalea profundi]